MQWKAPGPTKLRFLLDQSVSIVFYDLTIARIHGEDALDGDVRAFGLNKETRGIARKTALDVIQAGHGLPLPIKCGCVIRPVPERSCGSRSGGGALGCR